MTNPETVTPMTQVGALPRDDNDSAVTTLGLQQTKAITYSALTTGAVGTTTLFTVTGSVAVKVFAVCSTDLTGSGTIEIGTATSTASIANQQSATAIDNHEVYVNASVAVAALLGDFHIINENIIQTIGSDTITGGVLTFYCEWVPLSQGANIRAT